MAKLPGYIRPDSYTTDGKGHLLFHFTVRRWHPGYWLMLTKAFVKAAIEVRCNGRRSV